MSISRLCPGRQICARLSSTVPTNIRRARQSRALSTQSDASADPSPPPAACPAPRAAKFSTPSTFPSPAPTTASITARLEINTARTFSPSVRELLPQLRSQRPHFAQVHIHGRPYLVTEGDTIRLPFWMHGVQPGNVLRLNAATLLGSRDYVLKAGTGFGADVIPPTGSSAVTAPPPAPDADVASLISSARIVLSDESEPIPLTEAIDLAGFVPPVQKTRYLDDRLFICRATVLGVETEPMRTEIKKKQRTRRKKEAKSKHRYTVLRISELKVRSIEEAELVEPSSQ